MVGQQMPMIGLKGVRMLSRRSFLEKVTLAGTLPLYVGACSNHVDSVGYEAAAQSTWRAPSFLNASRVAINQELVRLATLAPSSHS
jgi:hypothetical protein